MSARRSRSKMRRKEKKVPMTDLASIIDSLPVEDPIELLYGKCATKITMEIAKTLPLNQTLYGLLAPSIITSPILVNHIKSVTIDKWSDDHKTLTIRYDDKLIDLIEDKNVLVTKDGPLYVFIK